MRALAVCLILVCESLVPNAFAQQSASAPEPTTAVCNFADETQISVRYTPVPSVKELRNGTLWTPGNAPMNLFVQTTVRLGPAEIPVGAYSMFIIPGKKEWTLIVNKNVTAGSAYDQKQDIVRVSMETGKLSEPTPVTVAFAHMSPKECNIRIYYGTTGAFADFTQK